MNLKLYLLTQNDNTDSEALNAMIVCAKSKKRAKQIHPDQNIKNFKWNLPWSTWADSPEKVKVKYLGKAGVNVKPGIIMTTFNGD